MADNKESFILYADLVNVVDKLPVEKKGELFQLILDYVNDREPEVNDLLLEIAFEPIKKNLKRDLKKWEGIKEKRSQAGKKGAEARKQKNKSVFVTKKEKMFSYVIEKVGLLENQTQDQLNKNIELYGKENIKQITEI